MCTSPVIFCYEATPDGVKKACNRVENMVESVDLWTGKGGICAVYGMLEVLNRFKQCVLW